MKKLAFVLSVVALQAVGSAQQPVMKTGLKKLANDVYTWSDVHPTGLYLTNDLIVITSDGVLVADGQKDPPTTQKLVDAIKNLTRQPIRNVVVGSEHGDHIGGNSSFPAGATFISSPFSKATLQAMATADKPGRPKTIVPTETVSDRRVLRLGNTDIEIVNNGRAHTSGDIEVYLPAEKIFFVSEVFSNHIFPNMRTAPPSEWIQTLKQVRQVDARWVIPGHGPIDDDPAVMKRELDNFARAVEFTVAEATRAHHTGASVEAAVKQIAWGPYASWVAFDRNAQVAVQRVYDELDGKLK